MYQPSGVVIIAIFKQGCRPVARTYCGGQVDKRREAGFGEGYTPSHWGVIFSVPSPEKFGNTDIKMACFRALFIAGSVEIGRLHNG